MSRVLIGHAAFLFPGFVLPLSPSVAREVLQVGSAAENLAMAAASGMLNAVVVGNNVQLPGCRGMADEQLDQVVSRVMTNRELNVEASPILFGLGGGRSSSGVEDHGYRPNLGCGHLAKETQQALTGFPQLARPYFARRHSQRVQQVVTVNEVLGTHGYGQEPVAGVFCLDPTVFLLQRDGDYL
jgi:hypothetical protein